MTKTSRWKMQKALILAFVLTSAHIASTAEEAGYDFRHTRWGMSQQDVRGAENGEPEANFSKGSNLVWKLLDEPVVVVYTFAFNKLVRAKYTLAKYSSALQRTLYLNLSPKKALLGEFIVDFGKYEEA